MQSLDPRVNRLPIPESWGELRAKTPLDQLETYEVFHQTKPDKAFEHAGIVHAPNDEMAFLFGKEQYSRRGNTCSGIWTVATHKVMVTPYTEGDTSLYDLFEGEQQHAAQTEAYEIFHLKKRGKQHVHAGTVQASSYDDALAVAQTTLHDGKMVYNAWVIKSSDLFKSNAEDVDMWNTLYEKKYREAIDYRAQDKINQFKEEQNLQNHG